MFKRIRSESGFTLVELLVVLAIMAILVAVVVPNLAGITGGAQQTACGQELDTVQAAMDTLMTQNSASSVTAETTGTGIQLDSDSTVQCQDYNDENLDAESAFLLRDATDGKYSWDTTGAITQNSCP